MRRASNRGAGRRENMPLTSRRPTRRAHLRRCLLAPPCGVGGPRLSRRSSAPSIWALLVALFQPLPGRLIFCVSLAASLALAADLPRAYAQGDAKAGKVVYERKCLLCHGEKGDGKGAGAELLVPRPRDFTKGLYKIRATANKTPADQDVFNVVTHGMPG